MPQQKSRSRKRHQFWCHRRKSAPIWSLVLSTTDKIRQFWAENKLFSRKAHKNRFFVLYPLRDKKYHSTRNFWRFSMATLWGRKKFYQSGLFLALLDAYQMGEKFSKSFIKIEFSCSIPWKEKIIRKNFIFFALPCSTPWGNLSEISETIHKIQVFVLYHLRREKLLRQRRGFWLSSLPTYWGKKNIFSKGLIFGFSRDLPLEEENFEADTTFDLSKWEQVKKYSKQR